MDAINYLNNNSRTMAITNYIKEFPLIKDKNVNILEN